MKINSSSLREKRDFIIFGIVNLLITNIFLQIFLLIFAIPIATLFSQMINVSLGLYLYGKRVFRVRCYTKFTIIKYLMLSILLWNLNWYGIEKINQIVLSKNIAALIVLPILALISFLTQRNLIFNN